MGNFLRALQRAQQVQIQQFFCGNSLSKVREYYGQFKAISETYCIDNEQFAQLFGKHEQVFKCFDTDNNLLIDGLELFAGLIVLSHNIAFPDKVTFLFELFDFNDLKSLSKTDIEFLFISCCTAVLKICQMKGLQDDSYVEEFVREEFPTEERVNISEMLKWARKSDTVAAFFGLLKQEVEREQKSTLAQMVHLKLEKPRSEANLPSSYHYIKQEQFMLETQKLFRFPDDENELDMKNYDINPSPAWVYGIRYRDVRQFMEYCSEGGEELLIYFVGKVVVIYNVSSRKQRHYLGHQREIICLTLKGTLCATSEYAQSPQIRVWDYRTLQTVQILKGYHVQGVQLVKFLENGLLESPIIIFHIESGQAIYSTYCNSPAIDIALLANFTNRPAEQFIVCSLYQLHHFECVKSGEQRLAISTNRLSLQGRRKEQKITTCCFFMINCHYKHLRQYDERVEKHVMTGHENGVINVWNLARRELEYAFSQESNEIIRLLPTHNHLLAITNSSFISYYSIDIQEKEKLKVIDITQIDEQLANYDICECLINAPARKLLVVTQKADIFFLNEEECVDAPSISHFTHQKYKTQKIQHLLPIFGPIRMQKLLKKEHTENLYIAVGHTIKAIDVHNHSFMREWDIGQEIVSFDVIHTKAYGLFIVAATVQNKLYLFSNKSEGASKARVESEIVSVMAHTEESPAVIIVLVSTKQAILKYNIVKNSFANPYPISRPNFCPQLSPLQGNKVMLSAQNNLLFALIIKEMHIQALASTDYRTIAPLLKLFYHIPLQNRKILPVIVGCQAKALIAGRQDGKIYFWNSYEQLSNHNFVALDAHTSPIADLSYTHDQKHLFSCGSEDEMIIQWRFRYFNEEGSATISKMREESQSESLNISDEFSLRRVEFCKFKNDKLMKNYDQHIAIKGIKNDIIRRLFKSNINQWRIQNKILRLEESNLHLKMNFVFGIETYNQNGSVIALSNPKRFLYFVSKIIVIYYPAENDQEFYRGHKFRVTSIVLLQDKVRVASGESAYRPAIHIWNTRTLETLRIIKSNHRWGIIELTTHQNILLSFGLKEIKYEEEVGPQNEESIFQKNIYSYEVIDYEKGLVLATREEKDLVHSLAINPSNPYRFAACNDGRVTFWEVKFNIIIKRKVCWLAGDIPTCCTYYQPPKGDPDLLVGTYSGTLGMINREQYWTVFKKGEKDAKRINCILIVRRDPETLIVVASEDNIIKIYNQRMEERFRESMLKIEPTEEGSKKVRESKGDRQDRNCSIQSLSLITEAVGKSSRDVKEELRILLGTRNGQILQLIESKENRYGGNKTMNFKAILFLRFNTSQDSKRVKNKVLVTHHPKLEIIATIGHDQQIIFWDTEHNKLLHVTELNIDNNKKYPTAIKFSHSGDHLIIGFSNGELMFLQSKMSKPMQSKIDEKYCPLNLGKAKKEKDEDGQAVLNIELSQNGQYIAVSYQKIVGDKSYSYIKISHFKIKDKVKSNKNQYEKILDNTSILPCPHLEKSFHTQSGLLFGFAAYSLSFAVIQNTNKQYFLSYYQMIDENQNRLSINIQKGQQRNYNIWEVSDSIYPVTSPLIESIKWRKFYIHNAIQTSYIFHDTPLKINQRQDNPPSNNNLDLSEFSNMTILDQSILTTSFNGDIHIFKLGTLEGEEDGMIGKTIPAHCCKINQIEQFHNQNRSFIYTTGENDQCIIKWSVEKFEALPDNQEYAEEERDLFGEVPDSIEMKGKIQLYKKKADVERMILRNQNFIEWFKIRYIFGRRAEQVRNNLKYDKYDRIIYSSGHAVVIVDPETNLKEFIYVKDDPIHCLQEITVVEISKDGQYLISCHAGIRSGVMMWELNSKILLKRFYLKEIVQILYLIISEDNQRLVVYGITAEMIGQIVMIDVQNEQIMGVVTYSHKKAWQIKSLCFRPNSHDKFFTCGIQNIKEWQLMSNQIVNIMSYQNQDTIINTCIDFIGESLIVTNDRGELIIWCDSGEILRREEHQNMITCLTVSDDGLIATGSISSEEDLAQVIIWSFQSNDLAVVEKINVKLEVTPSTIQSSKIDSNKKHKEADVQSLHLNRNSKNHKVLIGVTKGDVYEYSFQPALKKQKNEIKQQLESKPTILASFQDQQKIKAMFFNNDQSQLFEISENGLLRIWALMKPELQWSHNFDNTTVNMIYSSRNELVIIAFKESLRFFKYCQNDQKQLVQVEENFKQVRCITHLVLGSNEKYIALGIQRNSDKANIIDLYEISSKQFKLKLHLEVQSPILFIDFNHFSNEKSYMLVNTTARPELFDLLLTLSINNEQISEIDWMNHGLQFSGKVKKTKNEHEEHFRDSIITRIIQIESDYIFLDYYAGVYLYREDKLTANCHLNISSIDTVAISGSRKWLAVGSKVDRNIVLIQLSQLVSSD